LRRLGDGGAMLVHDIVLGATRASLKDAVARFRPSIVHFIGHGAPGQVELRPDPGLLPAGAAASGAAAVDRCDVAGLFDALAPAAAEGRAAALRQLGGRSATVDWVYPTITIDARLPSAIVALADTDGARWRAAGATLFRKKLPFCDRLDVFASFGRWLRQRPD